MANNEIENAQRFSIYPNPANDEVSIELSGYKNQSIHIQLLDLNGKVLKTENIEHHFDTSVHLFALPELAAGMYIIKVQSENKVRTRTLVIQE